MPKISAIIVTYNAMKWAEKCFSSLRKSSIPVQIIVVDNGSTDGTQDYLKGNFPEIDFIQSSENLGFGKANNLGIEKAYKQGADFFYLMNQDAWIFEDSFQKMLDVYENYPNKEEIGILSPMHLDGTEEKLDFHFERYLARYTEFNRIFSDMYMEKLKPFYEINFVNAAHWLLPKSTVEKVGGFNPYFFHGAEDYDYINRTSYHQLKNIICTQSKVVHDAKKLKPEKDTATVLKNKRISIRMQRETKYLNPNFPFNIKREKREFHLNIIKLSLKGDKDESKFYKEMFNFFKPKFENIEKLRKQVATEKHVFLNLKENYNPIRKHQNESTPD
jgi:GT2 family glycosyltransferase